MSDKLGGGNGAVHITEDWRDPRYSDPFVEVDEERSEPVPHRYIRGGFTGTDARFSFYFPPKEQYHGRFFHNTYPLALTSDIGPFPIQFDVAMGNLGFTMDSGAYYVQTNLGGADRGNGDPSIAYRVNAAAAKYSRKVAADIYGPHRPYGYLYGGSGGSKQVMGTAELTQGIWDGFLPYVLGTDHAVPSAFTVRQYPLRVLRKRDKWAGVVDAIAPGGSGDPYADLDDEEAAALREATRFGYPLRGWWNHATLDSGYFANVAPLMPMLDPSYNADFWSKPGYLGHDAAEELEGLRRQHETTVVAVEPGLTTRLQLASLPDWNVRDAHVVTGTGDKAGVSIPIAAVSGSSVEFAMAANRADIAALKPGDTVRIDNSWAIAMQTYHRHQVPPAEEGLYGWDQYRGASGTPIYPQRDILVGPANSPATAGTLVTGRVTAKVLVLQAMVDIDALPWQADWYRSAVRRALGDRFDDSFALVFVDNAQHDNPLTPEAHAQTVSFAGALQQGLRDLASWVENGVKPAQTRYEVVDGQVVLPAAAAARGGIQPVVTVTANGGARADVAVGEEVRLESVIAVPPGTGTVVSAEWDFHGEGAYPNRAEVGSPSETVTLSATWTYREPGTYFPVLRAASQRDGDHASPYGRVENLGRARVVVSPK